jgi:hypothetical protein
VKQTRCVVGHGVALARDEVLERVVSMVPLVEGLDTQKVRGGGARGDRPFSMPIHRGKIVRACFCGAFADVKAPGGTFVVEDAPGKL